MSSNIPIKNIYYMLSYAFQVLNSTEYRNIATEEFSNTGDLFAEILCKGIEQQIKRYLNREYVTKEESLSCLRGKIEINTSIKQMSMLKNQLVCSFDEFSVDSYMNRVIKSCVYKLLNSDIRKNRKKRLKALLVYFNNVSLVELNKINWHFKFNYNNKAYQMLMGVCYLLVKGLLQTDREGNTKLMDFLDEQRMSHLYEKFILEYYRKEYKNKITASAAQIEWETDNFDMLPIMQSDITLAKNNRILIIDAKYYSHSTQVLYEKHTVHSANLYQIFTYVKNKEAELVSKDHEVAGMLLYARTYDNQLSPNDYMMSGNKIMVRTLDLDCDFEDIKKQLDGIVEAYFN